MLQLAQVDVRDLLLDNQRQIDLLLLDQSRLARELAAQEGDEDALHWLRFNCHVTSSVAAHYLAVAESEPQLEESVQAMEAGEIGFAHLVVMARTARAVRGKFQEQELLPVARESSPGKFYFKCLHYRHAVDAKAYAQEAERLAEGRALRLSPTEDGCLLITGILDPVAGAAARAALEPLARKSGAHDDRNREQRLADAFYELCTAGRPAHLQVTTTVETLMNLAGAPGAEMEFSLPIASTTVQRLACDSSLSRVLLEGRSLVIDVGQATRKIPTALRKALELRDKHCRWPGCERPAFYCDGHHLQHWIEGGPTELGNLVLLCKRHHRLHHEGGWQLVLVQGELMPVAPTTTFGLPRGPD